MKKLGPYKQAVKDAVEASNAIRIESEGEARHEYPDYETYRKVQVAENIAKLKMQFVKESHIELLSEYINSRPSDCTFGLCHGTRRGLEQEWFLKHLKGAPEVIGTEISETAEQFEHTVQWDFHDENPDWLNRADFVYSNSWDHAFDPEKAFVNWAGQLKPGGLMLLDHTKGQTPEEANALDPFGVTQDALHRVLNNCLGGMGTVTEVLDYSKAKNYHARVFVWARNAE
jgi:SAM-dependent methyltransferase